MHNAWCDSIAQSNWATAQEALETKQYTIFYQTCTQSLFYSLGTIRSEQERNSIEAQARTALQEFLGKLTVACSQPIISGKPGRAVETEISFTAKVGDLPFAGLVMIARLPNGIKVADLTTDTDGKAMLKDIKMPFVAYGTFLHIVPNFGACISSGYTFEASAFGVKLHDSQEQSLIFNMVKPVYSLNYQAIIANKADVPTNFSSDAWLRKFLEDSCHMEPVSGSKTTDLTIDIRCQISSYTFDEREETDLKVEVQASIVQSDGKSSNRTAVINKETFDSNHPIHSGKFFWQTTTNLMAIIRQMLMEL
jgi:hypothetical protein